MKRKAIIIRTNEDKTIAICVDVKNADEILGYINQSERHIKKFRHICDLILSRLKNRELYDKEEINSKCKGVTAMKFFKGQTNDRIYCKEQTLKDKTFVVITSELFEKKKTRKVTEKIKNVIEKVGSYEYEIIK